MHAHQHLNLALLAAPDGGFPGIPGSGPSGSGLPGIPGGTPSDDDGRSTHSQPQFAQPEPQHATGGGGQVFELAGWGTRFAAWLVDWIIILILSVPVLAIASALGLDIGDSTSGGSRASFNAADGQVLSLSLIYILVALAYAPTTMSRMQGSTLGKRMLGIRVVRADGEPVSFGFAFVREIVLKGIVVQAVSFVTIGLAGLVNYLWPLWDSENRAIHDIAAKSRVVRR